MSDYTADEVADAVDAHDSLDWQDMGNAGYGMSLGPWAVILRGSPEVVTREGGQAPAEGGGEDVSVVIRIGTQFFRKTGWYSSFNGADWDGSLTEVRPEEETVIAWVAV